MKEIVFGIDQIDAVIENYFISLLKTHTVFTFQGPLGAGKTTLIKTLFKKSGINEVVASPTFTYVKQYKTKDKIFNHFDLYRLHSLESFLELGFDEYLYQKNSISFIEWPSIIKPLLRDSFFFDKLCEVCVEYVDGDLEKRRLKINTKKG